MTPTLTKQRDAIRACVSRPADEDSSRLGPTHRTRLQYGHRDNNEARLFLLPLGAPAARRANRLGSPGFAQCRALRSAFRSTSMLPRVAAIVLIPRDQRAAQPRTP